MVQNVNETNHAFRLKPVKSARVSEISEITAASSVAPEERINFHIGNPLQDSRLSSTFLRIALGIDVQREDLNEQSLNEILDYLGWGKEEKHKLEYLVRTIQKSSPYMPRGGYARKNPHALIKALCDWLKNQQEPLEYDTGEQSGRREMILASGGIHEALRIFFFALNEYMVDVPVQILLYRYTISPLLQELPNLIFQSLPEDEDEARAYVQEYCRSQKSQPTFIVLGDRVTEKTRRYYRTQSIEYPLFFLEVNDVPNHLSLAREAKLVHRVVRFLTPGIFSPYLRKLSIVFLLGNADFLNVVENVHFNLKGTPSAAEVELLITLLEYRERYFPTCSDSHNLSVVPVFEGFTHSSYVSESFEANLKSIERAITTAVDSYAEFLDTYIGKIAIKTERFTTYLTKKWSTSYLDEFGSLDVYTLLEQFFTNIENDEWLNTLQRSFLAVFLKHQPQYDPRACTIVSGSSRTALGVLGFHCGIREVVIPDLSWSYEQCFPVVHAVPLTSEYELDAEGIIEKIEALCREYPSWPLYGALVINNPHNATGRIFSEHQIRKLVSYCLTHGITVIDDLSYQNVAPVRELPHIKTVREIAHELVQRGECTSAQAQSVITVHSMSKTDCLAGARLAVVEIPQEATRRQFVEITQRITPNYSAIFLCYLFYRGSKEAVEAYWRLRNSLFCERTEALCEASRQLPAERNPYKISIIPPTGSMYPLLKIELLPSGLSLDWLASSLARRGIGMLPLSTFARTEAGYEAGRTTFRLTLGGVDGAETLLYKTRTLLIHLNRLISDESAQYNRICLPLTKTVSKAQRERELSRLWEEFSQYLYERGASKSFGHYFVKLVGDNVETAYREFLSTFLPQRLEQFRTQLLDRALLQEELIRQTLQDNGRSLETRLDREFMKDSLERRRELFRLRTHDRTVHPTQMYSLKTELLLNEVISIFLKNQKPPQELLERVTQSFYDEFIGINVSISSKDEADEILLDYATLVRGECFAKLFSNDEIPTLISFWSDWDGSNRPSGQGHRLVASVVMENVRKMARILYSIQRVEPKAPVSSDILFELEHLSERNERFTELLDEITSLTHQLELRYRGVLPFAVPMTPLKTLATKLHLRRDPVKVLWQHNDRYERKMLELRAQRKRMLEYYFVLNKKLRKQLHALIPIIVEHRFDEELLNEVIQYRDILQRVVITPRIQQGMITARDQFAVDTTVYNIHEINAICGSYGNAGMVLAIQISLSTKPEALISLERKLRARREQTQREHPDAELPSVWSIPLFEDVVSVKNIGQYLDHVWDYATQSRRSTQTPQERFTEILCEIFIAGSDLSQQIGEAPAAAFYMKAKYDLHVWLANHGITEKVRIKIGCGEPMQRQGGYYSPVAGEVAFIQSRDSEKRFRGYLPPATRKSIQHAVTPLLGIFRGGDLRTFQSNVSERLRTLPVNEYANLLYHVRKSQERHRSDLIRAAESIVETRLLKKNRTSQELERLTGGATDELYNAFLTELTENFKQILYGKEEDVVGIHAISYFIGRLIPQLRDRPTNRPVAGDATDRGQKILEHIAKTIPFAKRGSLLRAIEHNRAQTMVLGVNQLTTGLFRALNRFALRSFAPAEQETMLAERIIPQLPVYDILNTLRLYHDCDAVYVQKIEPAFPAGNSAFVALREDYDAMKYYIPLLQQELIRRHGVTVDDFFINGYFEPNLLPTVRPDLAVLLQKNIFNTSYDEIVKDIDGSIDEQWSTCVKRVLATREQIRLWREKIWDLIGDSIYLRVQSFTELATALYSFSSVRSLEGVQPVVRERKLSPALIEFFRTARAEDEMRNFLIGAVEYLSLFTEGNIEVPVSIVRAMNDIERLAQIEEHVLPAQKQNALRYYLLQIARLAGDNG
ncbi:MAG: pyridoxal phosphate-dependent aminotransferase [Bacteroidetes bacterium]|nr:pyridoxal phosphate-dependent aminotransferase [Bacteroidota bacterium]